MKKLELHLYSLSIVLLFIAVGCNSNCVDCNYSVYLTDNYFHEEMDTITLNNLPANIGLRIGEGVFITNGMSAFRFISVLEESDDNSSVQLQVDYYEGGSTNIVLNTNNFPTSYSLQNEYSFQIEMKRLSFESEYEIGFTYDKKRYNW